MNRRAEPAHPIACAGAEPALPIADAGCLSRFSNGVSLIAETAKMNVQSKKLTWALVMNECPFQKILLGIQFDEMA